MYLCPFWNPLSPLHDFKHFTLYSNIPKIELFISMIILNVCPYNECKNSCWVQQVQSSWVMGHGSSVMGHGPWLISNPTLSGKLSSSHFVHYEEISDWSSLVLRMLEWQRMGKAWSSVSSDCRKLHFYLNRNIKGKNWKPNQLKQNSVWNSFIPSSDWQIQV